MDRLTFLIPVRIDSVYRLRNLYAVLNFYMSHTDAKFIVLEASSVSSVCDVVDKFPSCRLKYIYIEDDKLIFHRTRYINQMLKITDTEVAAVWDTDAIAPVSQIEEAYMRIVNSNVAMVYPYNGSFWSVNAIYSEVFCNSGNLEVLTDYPQPRILMNGFHSVGGAFLVDVYVYRRLGWENEHFLGWGPEDAERYHRLEILGCRPERVDGGLYHLYHTRGVNSGDFDKETAFSTKKEYCKVCAMTKAELEKYVKSWIWIK